MSDIQSLIEKSVNMSVIKKIFADPLSSQIKSDTAGRV